MSSRIAIIALSKGGKLLADRLAALLPGSEIVHVQGGISQTLARAWQCYDGLICIMAAGIVSGPLLRCSGSVHIICSLFGRTLRKLAAAWLFAMTRFKFGSAIIPRKETYQGKNLINAGLEPLLPFSNAAKAIYKPRLPEHHRMVLGKKRVLFDRNEILPVSN